ncbi:MAG: hypothetical protein NZM38_09790 [Cytophagales bacterium]|nr:hypothetical protein [Cytophagales bacterium]MDW8385048.1 hypothetical protein [Flammeovirgaceae bacterium]
MPTWKGKANEQHNTRERSPTFKERSPKNFVLFTHLTPTPIHEGTCQYLIGKSPGS